MSGEPVELNDAFIAASKLGREPFAHSFTQETVRMLRNLSIFVFAALIGCAPARARGLADWDLLGARAVNDRADHDVIAVTSARGDFRRIKFTVQRASVDFHRVVVHFGNGSDQRVEMRNTIPAGGESRAIDLEGTERVIRSIEFWYDANTIRGRRAQVRAFGMR